VDEPNNRNEALTTGSSTRWGESGFVREAESQRRLTNEWKSKEKKRLKVIT